jgi:hypothetical protein
MVPSGRVFKTEPRYANGVTMAISGDYPKGIKFYGTKGWIFVTRDETITATDPRATPGQKPKLLVASDPKILDSVIGPNEIRLY